MTKCRKIRERYYNSVTEEKTHAHPHTHTHTHTLIVILLSREVLTPEVLKETDQEMDSHPNKQVKCQGSTQSAKG